MSDILKLQHQRALVIGLGISGYSAARFLVGRGCQVTGYDQNQDLVLKHDKIAQLGAQGFRATHDPCDIKMPNFDFVVVSPGIPDNHMLYQQARQIGLPILGEVELACRFLNQKMLAVTGTNGKTTVTLLIAHVLKHAGIQAKALGNLGIPLTEELNNQALHPSDIIVAELSSYQLETLQCRCLQAAAILNITPDHLDRYPNMQAYAKAKIKLKDCLKTSGSLYIEEAAFKTFGFLLDGFPCQTYGCNSGCDLFIQPPFLKIHRNEMLRFPDQYKGKNHDLENITAAYALCREIGVDSAQFLDALATFKKPLHRIEYVQTIRGVAYYDDSKGTNIDAVIKAVQSLQGPILLIAGGVDKGAAYTPWIEPFKDKVKVVCAIGQAAEKIKRDLFPAVPVHIFENMEMAVQYAARTAREGENVLLSPGCSSFDMFKDYAHRGEVFKDLVKALQ